MSLSSLRILNILIIFLERSSKRFFISVKCSTTAHAGVFFIFFCNIKKNPSHIGLIASYFGSRRKKQGMHFVLTAAFTTFAADFNNGVP